jgi:hypothetical protein
VEKSFPERDTAAPRTHPWLAFAKQRSPAQQARVSCARTMGNKPEGPSSASNKQLNCKQKKGSSLRAGTLDGWRSTEFGLFVCVLSSYKRFIPRNFLHNSSNKCLGPTSASTPGRALPTLAVVGVSARSQFHYSSSSPSRLQLCVSFLILGCSGSVSDGSFQTQALPSLPEADYTTTKAESEG